jgi:hypothetical protein
VWRNADLVTAVSIPVRTAPLTTRILRVFDTADDTARWEGATWYEDARAQCVDLAERHHLVIDQAVGIVAALSPNMRWEKNITAADLLLFGSTNVTYPANVTKALRILDGEAPDDVLGGNKVRAFYGNVMSGGQDRGVTVDGHAANIARGIRQPIRLATLTHKQFHGIARAYQNAAARRGVTPPAMQAVTWVAWRAAA